MSQWYVEFKQTKKTPASNSKVQPNGILVVSQAAFQNIFDANMRHLEGVSANGDASNESSNGPQILGRLRIATGNPRANGLASGINPSNSLSQLIQIRSQRNSNRQRRCVYSCYLFFPPKTAITI